jgi:hypothetical protein
MRPWESVARRTERAGAWSCRRRLRGWSRFGFPAARGWSAAMRPVAGPWVRSGRFGRVGWRFRALSMAWPRRLIVKGFLTIRWANAQKVHATLGIRGAPDRAGRGMVLPRSAARMEQVRVPSARGWRAGGDAARCGGSGSFGSITYFSPRMRILRRAPLASGGLRPVGSGAVLPTGFGTRIVDRNDRAPRLPGRVGERDPNPARTGQSYTGHGGILSGLEGS